MYCQQGNGLGKKRRNILVWGEGRESRQLSCWRSCLVSVDFVRAASVPRGLGAPVLGWRGTPPSSPSQALLSRHSSEKPLIARKAFMQGSASTPDTGIPPSRWVVGSAGPGHLQAWESSFCLHFNLFCLAMPTHCAQFPPGSHNSLEHLRSHDWLRRVTGTGCPECSPAGEPIVLERELFVSICVWPCA